MIGPNNGAVVNVLSYIPVQYWDGIRDRTNTTDLSTYIQNAIDYAELNSVSIFFPEGRYYVTSGLTLQASNVTLFGEGRAISEIYINDTTGTATALALSGTIYRWKITDLRIMSDQTNQAATGISLVNTRQGIINNINVYGFSSTGIMFGANCWTNRILNSEIDACSTGLVTGDQTNSLRVQSLEVTDSIGSSCNYGIDLGNGGNGIYFDHLQLESYQIAGIYIHADSATNALRGVRFDHLYTEMPDTIPFLLFDDSTHAIQIDNLVFDSAFLKCNGISAYDSAASMLLTHASSYANVSFNSAEFYNSSTTPTNAVFDITAKVKLNVSEPVVTPSNSTIATTGIASAFVEVVDTVSKKYVGVFRNSVVSTFTSADATPSVANGEQFFTAGSTAITFFDNGYLGQIITIFATAAITITHSSTLRLASASNFTMNTASTLTLRMLVQGVWDEIGRKAT